MSEWSCFVIGGGFKDERALGGIISDEGIFLARILHEGVMIGG